jgi:hypothetical protein
MSDTRKELVTMLQTAKQTAQEKGETYKLSTIQTMITRAEMGYYHDFKSDHPTPKSQLINDLMMVGLKDIAQLVMDGEFDEEPDEEDTAKIKADLHEGLKG